MFPPPAAQISHKVPSACQARSPPQNSHLLRWGLHFTRRRRQPVHIFQGEIPVRPPQTARPTRADAGRSHGVAEVICAAAGIPPTIFQRMCHRFYAASGIELDQLVKQVTRTTSSHHVRNMRTTQYATTYCRSNHAFALFFVRAAIACPCAWSSGQSRWREMLWPGGWS
jgi:hypothetical protein